MISLFRQWTPEDLEALSAKDKILSIETQAKEMILYSSLEIEADLTYLDTLVNTMQALIQLKSRAPSLVLPMVKRKYCSEQEDKWINYLVGLQGHVNKVLLHADSTLVDSVVSFHTGAVHLRHKVLFEITNLHSKRCLKFLEFSSGWCKRFFQSMVQIIPGLD